MRSSSRSGMYTRTSRRIAGYTVVEMLLVLAMTALILAASFAALGNSFGLEDRARDSRAAGEKARLTEERIRGWVRRTMLSNIETDTASYFIGGDDSDPNSLTFTALAARAPASMENTDLDFESQNERFGTVGGTSEVSFSLTGIGNGSSESGLFLRVQTPADGDPTQGGYQEVLDPDIDSMTFEFWDGLQWVATWNTQAMSTPRLPAAVRITYHRNGEGDDRILTVQIPSSDATEQNPVITGEDATQ